MEPVMTQPTEGEIWKMWDTDDGSISLSWGHRVSTGRYKQPCCDGWPWTWLIAYGDLLLGQDDGAVLAPDAYRHDVGSRDSLEGILCINRPCQPGIEHYDAYADQASCYTSATPHPRCRLLQLGVCRQKRTVRYVPT